ncbi:ABC transporter ATP-binding protein [Xanthobacter oligotrophicus]|uniref:ABC transporter ATP-binding protein n=1 Tax=Xanthobacter oligotrophicus TaxID=2607286 RepID=UPI0011F167B0|nr:ABC transporter ATP-binding protein [Xanthobacter oligotrophicus]MCG5235904.1 ABC transporter ATP-binding protein/permease [Xanthobacter oligotrophicus]
MSLFQTHKRGVPFRAVFAFLLGHWRRRKGVIAATAAAVLVATLAEVFVPLFAGRLIGALAGADREAAWQAATAAFLAIVALGAVMVTARHFTYVIIVRLTLRMMSDLAADAFARVQRFSADWHASTFAGSTVRKISRGMWSLDVLHDTLLVALFPSVVALAGSAILLGLHWPVMGLVVAVGAVAFVTLTLVLSLNFVAPAARLSNAWDTRVGGVLADAVGCNAVVKGFGAEEREEARLSRVLAKWNGRTRRTWMAGTWAGTAQLLALVALQASIIGTALMLWRQGAASAGDIAYVLTTYLVVHSYLRDIGMHVHNLQRSLNELEELVEIHQQPVAIADAKGAVPIRVEDGRIAFEHVTFHYRGHGTPLFEDLNVTIDGGERVGLVGHSGSGKTTFVKLIQRLHDVTSSPVTSGRVTVDGQDVRAVTQGSLRRAIAVVQQEPVLFHRSLMENIAYGRPDASFAEIRRAAELANAAGFIERMPRGYGTLVGERGVKLSGGERQRIAIARAFLADARILILDEATSSLDSESEAAIQEAMERLMVGRTTLVIAHRLSTVRSLDRLLVFDRGRIVEEGDHDALVQREGGLYRRLFERQAMELARGLAA